jgi:hypothetical protein
VGYSADSSPRSLRILSYSPGSRGQNDVVINELNFVENWVEVFHTLGTAVNLSSPSQLGLEIWRTNPPENKYFVDQIVLAGSTNSQGYATFNLSLVYSNSGKTYYASLWCSNCSAGATGEGNNTTYVDSVQIPLSTSYSAWGRYPNGNGAFRNTTNNTKDAENQIPGITDLAIPLAATLFLVAVSRRAGTRRVDGRPALSRNALIDS